MKVEHATVYKLSPNLDLTIRSSGAVTLQRSTREPVVLSPAESRNLRAALAPTTTEGATP